MQGKGDQSTNRQHKSTSLVKNCYAGNQMSNGLTSKHDGKEKVMAFLSLFCNKCHFELPGYIIGLHLVHASFCCFILPPSFYGMVHPF